MTDKAFLDSNVLIYLPDENNPKGKMAFELLKSNNNFVISVQVLNEFTSVCFKKRLLEQERIEEYTEEFTSYFKVADVNLLNIATAFEIKKQYKYAWYDCLIIATALLNKCSVLYSEDLQHKQVITLGTSRKASKLTIINPFV